MPSIVLYVSQGPAANCKAFSFLIMMHHFKGIMSSNHLLKSVSCCPSCLLTGVLNCHVVFMSQLYHFHKYNLGVSQKEGGICSSGYGADFPPPFTHWAVHIS